MDLSKKNISIGSPPYSKKDWTKSRFSNKKATINVGTLFSGIGSIEYALRLWGLNHKIVFAGDIDKHVKENYTRNYDFSKDDWHDDVTKFLTTPEEIKKYKGKVDLIVGGSPCQSFSMVGKRGGFDDTRGTLFHEFIRVIRTIQPKVFIYENVKGLLSHDKGKTWEIVQKQFELLKYKTYPMILNARDYGIPQNRERIFVIGFLDKNVEIFTPRPIELPKTMQDYLLDDIDEKYFLSQKGIDFVTNEKNLLKQYTQINGEIALCQKANQQFNWHGDFVFQKTLVDEKYYLSDKVKKYVLSSGTKNFSVNAETDLPVARTLVSTMHKMHRAGVDNYVTHNQGRIRKLTPRECLRLMGYLDDFEIFVSDTQMYRQAGNSIVVNVLMAILKEIDITKYGR
jgi:DNA (cytosine-5)-methyltransferase 1